MKWIIFIAVYLLIALGAFGIALKNKEETNTGIIFLLSIVLLFWTIIWILAFP